MEQPRVWRGEWRPSRTASLQETSIRHDFQKAKAADGFAYFIFCLPSSTDICK